DEERETPRDGAADVAVQNPEVVQVMTVHAAKGLEWDLIAVPGMSEGRFPSVRSSTGVDRASGWAIGMTELPYELRGDAGSIPQVAEASNAGVKDYAEALRTEQRHAEDRLGYVAVTRAKRILIGSAHTWRPETAKPRKPSPYLQAIMAEAELQGRVLARAPEPEPGQANPLEAEAEPVPWPQPLDPDARARRADAGQAVAAARTRHAHTGDYEPAGAEPALLDEAEIIAGWDDDVDRLLAEARETRRGRRAIALPSSLSATGLLTAARDPQAYAAALIRPMPGAPSPAARFGTRFHQWIERHYATRGAPVPLVDTEDLPERDTDVAGDERELRELCAQFAAGVFGERVPHRMEVPFVLLLDGLAVRGRIDAVYRSTDPAYDWQVVDWKTGRGEATDPGQLALYRRAWAELAGVPEERVDAVFYLVRSNELIRPALPDPQELLRQTLR
ncbi:MAG: 3'-5' exonuclease, partial [Propionibacteriaceae bacterium]|nr:3'-5' exonuclease [Propionibacteriaceae bacterium]